MPLDPTPRRGFIKQGVALGLAAASGSALGLPARLLAQGPDDPEVPNEEVARILREISGGRPIQRGHVSLDMPVVAEDGRVVPVVIEADLPMTADEHVRAVHLVVDHNPDAHLAAFELSPAMGRVYLQTRIKMKRTTWVRAIAVTSKGDAWADYAKVSVSLNGCG